MRRRSVSSHHDFSAASLTRLSDVACHTMTSFGDCGVIRGAVPSSDGSTSTGHSP
jgi:hypothetical protein